MRARFFAPNLRRFVNSDVIIGSISNAITLNRYAYANANPVSNIDPLGLDAERGEAPIFSSQITSIEQARTLYLSGLISIDEIPSEYLWDPSIRPQYTMQIGNQQNQSGFTKKSKSEYEMISRGMSIAGYSTDILLPVGEKAMEHAIRNSPRPNNLGKGIFDDQIVDDVARMHKMFDCLGYAYTSAFTVVNTSIQIEENIKNGESKSEIISDAVIDIGSGAVSIAATIVLAKLGTIISPGWGTVIGLGVGLVYDRIVDPRLDSIFN